MTPMDSILNRVKWRCTVCRSTEACGCWITLHCGQCKREKRAQKDPTDPKETAVVRCLCPECAGGDFSEVLYFDKDGKQLVVDASSDIHSEGAK